MMSKSGVCWHVKKIKISPGNFPQRIGRIESIGKSMRKHMKMLYRYAAQ
jgi:hypothetical protein